VPPGTIAYFCILAGLSMLAGWWTVFRNRPYLAFLGGFFLSLAAVLTIGGRIEAGEKTAAMKWGWWAAVGVAAVLITAAFYTAVQESRAKLREMREHYRAAADAMLEMARIQQELARRRQEEAKGEPQQDDAKPE